MTKLELSQIRNLTNGMEIHSSAKSPPLEAVEWKDMSLVFQTVAKAAPGQLVALEGQITIENVASAFKATGRITSVVPEIANLNRMEIHLQQFDKILWAQFLKSLRNNQNRVDDLFNLMRGED